MGCTIERAASGSMETINACAGGFADRDVRGAHRNGIGVVTGINGPQFVVVQFETIVGRDRNRIAVDLLTVDVILHRRIIHRSIGGHGRGQRQRVAKSGGGDARDRGGSFRFAGIFLGNDQREVLLDLAAIGVRSKHGELIDSRSDVVPIRLDPQQALALLLRIIGRDQHIGFGKMGAVGAFLTLILRGVDLVALSVPCDLVAQRDYGKLRNLTGIAPLHREFRTACKDLRVAYVVFFVDLSCCRCHCAALDREGRHIGQCLRCRRCRPVVLLFIQRHGTLGIMGREGQRNIAAARGDIGVAILRDAGFLVEAAAGLKGPFSVEVARNIQCLRLVHDQLAAAGQAAQRRVCQLGDIQRRIIPGDGHSRRSVQCGHGGGSAVHRKGFHSGECENAGFRGFVHRYSHIAAALGIHSRDRATIRGDAHAAGRCVLFLCHRSQRLSGIEPVAVGCALRCAAAVDGTQLAAACRYSDIPGKAGSHAAGVDAAKGAVRQGEYGIAAGIGHFGGHLSAPPDAACKQMDLSRAGAAGHILCCEVIAVDENGVMVLVGEVQFHIPHGHIGAQHDAARPDIELTRGAVLTGDGHALADNKRRHAALLFGVGKGFALDDDRVAIHRLVQGILKFGIRLFFAAVTHTLVGHICVDGVSRRKCRRWQQCQQQD